MTDIAVRPDVLVGEPRSAAHTFTGLFTDPGLFNWLNTATVVELDTLPYGVIAMSLDGTVEAYNLTESKLAGLTPERVIGKNFFSSVAPCTNNFMVAHRFQTEADLDVVIDYVLTLRMTPRKVQMRMLRRHDASRMFLIIQRRP